MADREEPQLPRRSARIQARREREQEPTVNQAREDVMANLPGIHDDAIIDEVAGIDDVSEPASMRVASSGDAASVRSHTSNASRRTRASNPASTASSARRRLKAQAELEAAEAAAKLDQEALETELKKKQMDAELEKKKMEAELEKTQKSGQIQKALVMKRLEVKLAEIDEDEGSIDDMDSDDGSQKLNDCERDGVRLVNIEQVRKWMQSEPPIIKPPLQAKTPKVSIGDAGRTGDYATGEAVVKSTLTSTQGAGWEQALVKTIEVIQMQAKENNRREVCGTFSEERKQESARRTIGRKTPTFSGKCEEWPAFKNMFNKGTKLCGFSEDENILRLQECLKGEAREAVQALFNAPSNVPVIMKTLELRFGKPEFIVEALIAKTQKFTPMREDQYDKLVTFATVVNNLATTAKALACDHHMLNPSLRKELVDRLPISWRTQWGAHILQKELKHPSIAHLSEWLNMMAELLSNIYIPKSVGDEKMLESTPKARDRFKKKESVFVVSTEETLSNAKKRTKSCTLCDRADHGLWECKSFEKKDLCDRWNFVKSNKLCFACLLPGHRTEACKYKRKCGKNGCTRQHHQYLHSEKKPPAAEPKVEAAPARSVQETEQKPVFHVSGGERIIYKVVPVTLKGPRKSLKSFALLDEGSRYTLIDDEVAAELELNGPKIPLQYNVAGNMQLCDQDSRTVSLKIADSKNRRSYHLSGVRTKKDLGMPSQTFSTEDLPQKWAELDDIDLESMENAKPSILIGLDNSELIASIKVKIGPKGAGILGKTRLGWTFYGRTATPKSEGDSAYLLCQFATPEDELHRLVKESFSIEAFGVKVQTKKLRSKEDQRALQIMEAATKRVGDHWETGLVWRNDQIEMPDSKLTAMHRLQLMEKKMDKDPVFASAYLKKIQDYLDAGYAKYLTAEEAKGITPKTWYLPHFGVINPNKPGKMRFVLDAAAKSRGACLNDFLLPGPDLLTSLPGNLIKFRQRKIGFSGDIKEFFHRVKIRQEDQSSQRFLWRGMDRNRDPDTLVMTVNTFGATCSPFTSQAAKNMNAKEFEKEFPEAAKAIIYRHYMDDYLDSVDSVAHATQLICDVVEVHRRGDFHIGKFVCNSEEVMQSIPAEVRGEGDSLDLDSETATERILGLAWNPKDDSLGFNIKFHKVKREIITGQKTPTKRDVLKVVMSVFDPLGLLGHFVVQGKILLQDVWRSGIGWDDELAQELNTKWTRWMNQLGKVCDHRIPRCYAPTFGENATRQLHLFCDASSQAFSAVAYLRSENNGEIRVSIVMAKTRVAPLKTMTIPKLELQAAVMATRLAQFIKAEMELSIDATQYWTDSMTVIRWLRSDTRNYKIFVAHRIGEIIESTNVAEWRWVPTKLNVADDATRDDKPADLSSTSRWVNGPPFLSLPKEMWPVANAEDASTEQEELERKPALIGLVDAPTTGILLPDITRFSSWLRLIAATARVPRCAARFLQLISRSKDSGGAWFTTGEMRLAENRWTKHVQATAFGAELEKLKNGHPLDKRSHLYGLSPILDEDGIIRMDGRTKNAPQLTEENMRPVILPSRDKYTELLVAHYHRKTGHHGRESVFNHLREKYWILEMRRAVKRSWTNCQQCRNARAKPIIPEMGQLPASRLTPNVKPFTFCGVDYFGPMEVTIGRRHEKRWGVLFTCLTMRAIHLELADSLSTDSCIMALRRMINRRGAPKQMWSDNGTNFHGADNELKLALSELDQTRIAAEMTQRGVDWHFIPPASPHMGGSWERLVRSVKVALKAVLKERAPRAEILHTFLTEAENTVNMRPLTHVSLDPDDPRPLTPNDLLIGHGTPLPPGKFTDMDYCARKMWRYSQRLADDFWRRWIREYLPTLTRRIKWLQPTKPIKVGDIVVLVDDTLERNHWPLGSIVNVFPGRDGQVRVVEVKTSSGAYKRPVVKVAVLDVCSQGGVGPADTTPGGRMSRIDEMPS